MESSCPTALYASPQCNPEPTRPQPADKLVHLLWTHDTAEEELTRTCLDPIPTRRQDHSTSLKHMRVLKTLFTGENAGTNHSEQVLSIQITCVLFGLR